MLFLTRACLCIGTIVVLAEGFDAGDLMTASQETAGLLVRSAADPIGNFCRSKPAECLAAASAALGVAGRNASADAMAPARSPRASEPRKPPPSRPRTIAAFEFEGSAPT